MPSIALSKAAYFTHFHMRDGSIAALHDAKSVACGRMTGPATSASRNKFARDAVAAAWGIAYRRLRRMRNDILPAPRAACHRATPFRGCRHVQVFIRGFDLA
jgi:hypothetical protein